MQPYIALVDVSGDVRFPLLGSFRAAGRTLDELIETIALEATGRQIRVNQNGLDSMIVLDGQNIFLDIDSYRPVIVTGAVTAPGRIDFEPGLTARAAIGMAGGLDHTTGADDPNREIVLQGRLGELRETRAWLMADLWRIDYLLGETGDDAIPADYASTVQSRLKPHDLEVVRQRIDLARVQREREREDVSARIGLTQARIDFLGTALEQYKVASYNEEERLQDVLELSNRGLVTAGALDSAQDGALNASSRVLTTEADLAEAAQQLQSFRGRLAKVDADFRESLLEDRAQRARELAQNGAMIDTARNELSAVSLLADTEGETAKLSIILYRRDGEEEQSRVIPPSAFLEPGDVVEVVVTLE